MSTVRGIHFEYNKFGRLLEKLFSDNRYSNYTWYVSQTDAHLDLETAFPNGTYTNSNLCSLYGEKDWYIIQARMLACDESVLPTDEINTYEEFLLSGYKIAVICADGMYDIYAKDPLSIKQIEEVCKSLDCKDICYITDENDGRTRLQCG